MKKGRADPPKAHKEGTRVARDRGSRGVGTRGFNNRCIYFVPLCILDKSAC